jgi:hypothetical protein
LGGWVPLFGSTPNRGGWRIAHHKLLIKHLPKKAAQLLLP